MGSKSPLNSYLKKDELSLQRRGRKSCQRHVGNMSRPVWIAEGHGEKREMELERKGKIVWGLEC